MLTPEQNERLRELFASACELPPGARADFCAEQCRDDPALRAELEAMVAVESRTGGSFLETPAPLGDAPASTGTPEQIGPYRVLERIGEGGMGVVYRAAQIEPVQREVALKVIKPGMDSARVLSRFDAERQALARMDHPHIARIHDAGAMDDGRPYFAMELVRGEPLTTWCDRQRLDLEGRLRILSAVCDAVQHAHQKGIVHRDLKPSNILVTELDGVPVPKIIDFGIARAMTDTEDLRVTLTGQGEMVGTLQYMSPEQAAGDPDIDARADIYALGVVLYELITGELPFRSADLADRPLEELRRMVCEQDPLRPSTRIVPTSASTETAERRSTDSRSLRRSLVGDLDWITLAALDRDRERRYASASELAADLRRFLAHEPVSAGPPSRLYKLRKFARRNRSTVVATAAVCVAVLTGLAATATALVWALDEEDKARIAQLQERTARSAAETSAQQARARAAELQRVVDFQATQLADLDAGRLGAKIRDELWNRVRAGLRQTSGTDAVEAVDQNLAELDRLARNVDFRDMALGLLEQDVFERTLRTIDARFGDQPSVQARLLLSTAQTMEKLGLGTAALPPANRAWVLGEQYLGATADPTISALLLVSFLRMQAADPDLDAIEDLMLDARDRSEARGVPPDGIAVEALRNLRGLRMHQDRAGAAIDLARRAVAAAETAFGTGSVPTARAVEELGNSLTYAYRFDEARPHIDRATKLYEAAGMADQASRLRLYFASELLNSHDVEHAIRILEREVPLLSERLGADDPETLTTRHNLAMAYSEGGRAEDAQREILAILPLLGRLPRGAERTRAATDLLTAAQLQLGAGKQAERNAETVQQQLEQELGSDDLRVIEANARVGMAQLRQGRFAEAEPSLRAAFEAFERSDRAEALGLRDEILGYGIVLRHLGRREEAAVVNRKALELHQELDAQAGLGPSRGTAASAFQLGVVLAELNRPAEAEQMLALAVEAHRASCPGMYWELQKFLDSHGHTLIFVGERDAEAAAVFEESLVLLERCRPEQIPEVRDETGLQVAIGRRAGWCAKAWSRAGQPRRAVEHLRKALATLEPLRPPEHPAHWELQRLRCTLGLALGRLAAEALRDGVRDEAERLAREAIDRYETGAGWIFAQPPIYTNGPDQPELAEQVTAFVTDVYQVMNLLAPDSGHDQTAARWQERLAARLSPATGALVEQPFEAAVAATVFADSQGNLWFGSEAEGVCRFDGKTLVRFTTENGLSDDHVRRIQEGPDGHIWFECAEGLSYFDGESMVTPTERVHDQQDAWRTEPGDLWFKSDAPEGVTDAEGAPGAYRYDGSSLTWLKFPLETGSDSIFYPSITSVAHGAGGRTWFGTYSAVLGYDGKEFTTYDAERLGLTEAAGALDTTAVFEDAGGRLWIGSNWNGVFVCEGDSIVDFAAAQGLGSDAEGGPGALSRISAITSDPDGNLWFGTPRHGAWRWDGEDMVSFGPDQGLASRHISGLHVDRDGQLWAVGGRPGGVYRFQDGAFVRRW